MRHIIRLCHENGLDLATEVRKFIKSFPKVKETGIYKGN
jgi:hypothetical protein